MQPIDIPQTIDDPPMLLLWRSDDLAPLLLLLIAGIATDMLLASILVGLAGTHLYSKYRASKPEGFALHWCWWHGLWPVSSRSRPNPFRRLWTG